MYISVQFKNKNKEFVGKHYDYELLPDEKVPAVGSIIRMMDENYNFVCYGTRVMVTSVKMESASAKVAIRCLETTLDDDEQDS